MTALNFSDGVAFLQGKYVPIADASIPMTDWGFLRSDACYDMVTVWDGRFFRLDAHLERFMRSCRSWRLDPGLTPESVTDVLAQCVRLSGLRASYVEMICTRGKPPWGSRVTHAWQATSSMPLPCPMSGSPMSNSVKLGFI